MSDRAQDRASDLEGDDDGRWPPVVEVLLDDNTPRRRARGPGARASRPTNRRNIRSTIGVLAIGALGGFVVSQAFARPDQPLPTMARETTTVFVAKDATDCRLRPSRCTTEEYRGSSPAALIASVVATIATHAPLDCQLRAGRCATEDYRLVPATPITVEPSGGIEP